MRNKPRGGRKAYRIDEAEIFFVGVNGERIAVKGVVDKDLIRSRSEAIRPAFRILRTAYQHALDTVTDNPGEPETVRDYWPECIRMAIADEVMALA